MHTEDLTACDLQSYKIIYDNMQGFDFPVGWATAEKNQIFKNTPWKPLFSTINTSHMLGGVEVKCYREEKRGKSTGTENVVWDQLPDRNSASCYHCKGCGKSEHLF